MIDRRRFRGHFDSMRDVCAPVVGYYLAGLCFVAGVVTLCIAIWGVPS